MEKLWHRIGRRGATLLLFSMVDVTIAYSMLSVPTALANSTYLGHRLIFPLHVWAYIWLGAAAVLFINAFRKDDRIGFGVAMGIKMLWACGFLTSFFLFNVPRAIIGACMWGLFAGWLFLVAGWPEAAKDHHVDDY